MGVNIDNRVNKLREDIDKELQALGRDIQNMDRDPRIFKLYKLVVKQHELTELLFKKVIVDIGYSTNIKIGETIVPLT